MKVILVTMGFGILYFIHLPALLQKGYGRDLTAFTVFMLIAFLYSLLLVLGVKLPFIATEITKIFMAFSKFGL